MKKMQKLLLVALLSLKGTTKPLQHELKPENTIIITDLDDVLIQKSSLHKLHLVAGGAWKNPQNTIAYLQSLNKLRSKYTKDADGAKNALQDQHGNKINGLTFQFLYHGSQDINLTSYVPWIINTMEQSRCYINDTKKLYEYVGNKGYPIVAATNKDRTSFDIVNEKLTISSVVQKTFVAHSGNSDEVIRQLQEFAKKESTPIEYTQMLKKTVAIEPSEKIHHVPYCKPNIKYHRYVETQLEKDKPMNMIFIDDKKENTDSFKELQAESDKKRLAIHFKSPTQLANKFVKLGILSEEEDKKILEEIRHARIW